MKSICPPSAPRQLTQSRVESTKNQEGALGDRFIPKSRIPAVGVAVGLAVFLVPCLAAAQNEWVTWGYDQQRSGWNRSENLLSKDNVYQLELKWKAQLSTSPREEVLSTLTAPLVASVNGPQGRVTRVFVVGSDNTVYAIDAETGKITWERRFP